ncbi:MAG: YkgJ family cysteine cluster protein [Thermoprotei archaeon]|nr:MAG: YkgJ family cysteine cluster protein [Thermoprotei archaeon]
MNIDFTPFFKRYEKLVSASDQVFERIKQEHSDCVKCYIGCADCCHALFDLTLIESLYINHHFNKKYSGKEKDRLIEKCNQADRKIYKLKKEAYKEFKAKKNETEILMRMAKERVRCPLLNDKQMCDLYEYRPVTCRTYGIPTSIAGLGHTCGISGFDEGKPYPTLNIDKLQQQLYAISSDFADAINTKYSQIKEILMPVSMAVITEFNEEFLGVMTPAGTENNKKEGNNINGE